MMPGQEGTPYYNMSGRCLGQFTNINGDYNENGSCQFWNATRVGWPYRRLSDDPGPLGDRRPA
jgi:hypothetical protein